MCFFAALPKDVRRLQVLDLGCGTGRLALCFLEAGYAVTGLDLFPSMLGLAENRCAKYLATGKGAFLNGDMSCFRFENPFGMVVSTYNALNHLEPEGKLRGCFRSAALWLTEGAFF